MNIIRTKLKSIFSNNILYLVVLLWLVVSYQYYSVYEYKKDGEYDLALLFLYLMIISYEVFIQYILSFLIKNKVISIIYNIVMSFIFIITSYMYFQYGRISSGAIGAIIDSNPQEAWEYVTSSYVPIGIWLVIPYGFILFKLFEINRTKTVSSRFKVYSIVFCVLLPYISIQENYFIRHILTNNRCIDFADNIKLVFDLKRLERVPITSKWIDVTSQPQTKEYNYVVIIGESAQRDMFSFYGMNNGTTDKLSDLNGWTLISDAISPAVATRESVPRILSINAYQNIDLGLNVIDLVKGAGLKTYWFSNQGYFGKFDTPITQLAKQTQMQIFHNKVYLKADSDYILLDDLDSVLDDGTVGNLIFLHTMGSHKDYCKRIQDFKAHLDNFKPDDQDYCYRDTIYNTFLLIKAIQKRLDMTEKKYRIIYFSDHGLVDIPVSPYRTYGIGSLFTKKAVEIPLIFIDSENNDTGRLILKKYYMRDFIHTLAEWMGLSAKQIRYDKSIFRDQIHQEEYVYDGNRRIFLEVKKDE